ncbi:MAG: hypothetical protein ACTTI4_07080, partial [Prevotella fusca]|uniref:hypothetical protein n=1 Tax=Prevotella fusca TaxID=589436 RepID=UPI003FA093C4
GIYCKSIGRLLEAKRACIGFELHENSLQTLVDMGISCLLKMERHGICFLHLLSCALSRFVRPSDFG